MIATYVNVAIVLEFLAIALVYAVARDWPRAGYFFCGAGINAFVMWMR